MIYAGTSLVLIATLVLSIMIAVCTSELGVHDHSVFGSEDRESMRSLLVIITQERRSLLVINDDLGELEVFGIIIYVLYNLNALILINLCIS